MSGNTENIDSQPGSRQMWRELTNVVLTVRTYPDLTPDLGLRRQIQQNWRSRPTLSLEDWHQTFWQPLAVSQTISAFVYEQMESYSGLPFAKVVPDDRLTEDLQLPLVCWFDWECDLCDAFHERFKVEISDRWDVGMLYTVRDVVIFLDRQLLSVKG